MHWGHQKPPTNSQSRPRRHKVLQQEIILGNRVIWGPRMWDSNTEHWTFRDSYPQKIDFMPETLEIRGKWERNFKLIMLKLSRFRDVSKISSSQVSIKHSSYRVHFHNYWIHYLDFSHCDRVKRIKIYHPGQFRSYFRIESCLSLADILWYHNTIKAA